MSINEANGLWPKVMLGVGALCMCVLPGFADDEAGEEKEKPEFPQWTEVSKDFTKVVSTTEGTSLYGIWIRKKDGQVLAELPSGFAGQKHYIAMTTPTGEIFAGLQSGDRYVYWKRFDKRMALIEPNLDVRSTGDQESKDAIGHHFVDRVLIDVPIVCMGPNGQPVIDLDEMLLGKASTFYGGMANNLNKSLSTISVVKAFPENVEIAFEVPSAGGALKTFHYSISQIGGSPSYQPREADDRIGYFTTVYRDLGKYRDDEITTRYINRWHIEKAAPNLKLSPPKEPLVYYISHTVPIRYRRWVKEGIDYWNDAFEKVGISDAIVVQYQDKTTGAHMDKDPEDVRYNFIRWLSNDIGTAIGPSRAHPITGQILDADVVLTDGWIRHFWFQYNEYLPEQAMESFSPETIEWLERHPDWDPRVRLAPPAERQTVIEKIQRQRAERGEGPMAVAMLANPFLWRDEGLRELARRVGPNFSLCLASQGKSLDMSVMGLTLEIMGLLEDEGGDGAEPKEGETPDEEKGDLIDGVPEWFVGPMLADLTAHEVGHTLGLRHNFKASSIYSMAEINSNAVKGQKPFTASVMDYTPVNINMEDGECQGDYTMIGVGSYDEWAIRYGYGFDDLKKVLAEVAEPGHVYATDFDTAGTDPYARRYDLGADPLNFSKSRMRLAKQHRERIVEKFVKEGESWGKARRGYEITLGMQTSGLSMMANWLGGAFVNKDHKGDPGARAPLVSVDAKTQREALDFCIQNSFFEESFGLTPELLRHLTVQKWGDSSDWQSAYGDSTWPLHDRIAGIQASVMTMLLNPTTLRRVYDNEALLDPSEDAFTLPELMGTVFDNVWTELKEKDMTLASTVRSPMTSSLRRNLQREHVERLIDLSMDSDGRAAQKAITNLATHQLRKLHKSLGNALENGGKLDAYSEAHFSEAHLRIGKALDAQFIYNTDDMGGGGGFSIIFLGEEEER